MDHFHVTPPHPPPPQVVKKLWEYIKANELQDPRDRRRIILDARLATIFPGKAVNMLTMNKHLSRHVFTSGGCSPTWGDGRCVLGVLGRARWMERRARGE
jgi:hypothetical protein